MSKIKSSQNENNDSPNRTQKLKKVLKVVNIVADVLFYVLLAVIIVVLICFAVDKFSGEESYPFFGFRGMIVQTGSMSFKYDEEFLKGHDEQFQEGDLVFTRKLRKDEELKVYDIVTFKMGKATVIHRIVDIYEEGGTTYYVTKGDATPPEGIDSPKTIDQITGVYASNWGRFGVVVEFIKSKYGVLSIIVCLTVLIIAYLILQYGKNERKKAEKEKSVKKDKTEKIENKQEVSDKTLTNTSEEKPQENSENDLSNTEENTQDDSDKTLTNNEENKQEVSENAENDLTNTSEENTIFAETNEINEDNTANSSGE